MGKERLTILLFSDSLDKALSAFIIAVSSATMEKEVVMFFPFWGANVLRDRKKKAGPKGFLDAMFGWMMPKGPDKLTLSKMHMAGIGTALLKHTMRRKNVQSLPSLIETAQQMGVRLIACQLSMQVMGLGKEELVDGIEVGGAATFLEASNGASNTLFIS